MGIKDNLEKAAALFGDSHEPDAIAIAKSLGVTAEDLK